MVAGLEPDDYFDYSEIERAACKAGLILSTDFARSDGVCVPIPGQSRKTPHLSNKPGEAREYRHLIAGNTSYGRVNTHGEMVLEIRFGHNSSADPTEVIPDTLKKYKALRIALDMVSIPYDDLTGIAKIVWP